MPGLTGVSGLSGLSGLMGGLLPYAIDFSTLPDGALPAIWTGPTWTINGGSAVNTPTLGAELIVDGAFNTACGVNWTCGAGWAIGGGTGNKTAPGNGSVHEGPLTDTEWFRAEVDLVRTAGTFFILRGQIASSNFPRTGSGALFETFQVNGVSAGMRGDNVSVGNVDNFSYVALTNLFAYMDAGQSDVTVSANWTIPTYYVAGTLARYLDANNYLLAYHDTVEAILGKRVAGTWTELIGAVTAYAAGAAVEIRCSGATVQLFYNGAQVGADQTVNDALGTNAGLLATDVSCTCSAFSVAGN